MSGSELVQNGLLPATIWTMPVAKSVDGPDDKSPEAFDAPLENSVMLPVTDGCGVVLPPHEGWTLEGCHITEVQRKLAPLHGALRTKVSLH